MNDTDIETDTDVAIVGGGPAGLSAAMYLARANVRALIVDAGAPRHAAADAIHSLITHDGRPPGELRRLAHEQLAHYGDQVRREEGEVARIDGARGRFRLETRGGAALTARRVLLAVGVEDRLPEIPGVREAWAHSVHHCPFCWGFEGRGRRMGLLVREEASARVTVVLERLAGELHLFWAADAPVPPTLRRFRVHEGGIRSLDLDGRQVRAVVTESGSTVPLDVLYLHPDQVQVPLVRSLGLQLDPNGLVAVDPMLQTSAPGVYAAGDLLTRRQQVVHALWSGAEAATGIVFDLGAPPDLPSG